MLNISYTLFFPSSILIETYKESVVEYNKSHVTNGSAIAVKSDVFIDNTQDKDDSADDNKQWSFSSQWQWQVQQYL